MRFPLGDLGTLPGDGGDGEACGQPVRGACVGQVTMLRCLDQPCRVGLQPHRTRGVPAFLGGLAAYGGTRLWPDARRGWQSLEPAIL